MHCLLWLQKLHQSASFNAEGSDDEGEEGGYQSELQMIFESMTGRMIKSEMEDFELVNHEGTHKFQKPNTAYSVE